MYDIKIMKLALDIASLSKDPSAKVGCIITNNDNEILSVGYNKLKNCIPLKDVDYINSNKEIKKYAFIHAEYMALNRLKETAEELSFYITFPSCINCTVEYILNNNYNVKNVYYINRGSESFYDRYKVNDALELMKYKNVNIVSINSDTLLGE